MWWLLARAIPVGWIVRVALLAGVAYAALEYTGVTL